MPGRDPNRGSGCEASQPAWSIQIKYSIAHEKSGKDADRKRIESGNCIREDRSLTMASILKQNESSALCSQKQHAACNQERLHSLTFRNNSGPQKVELLFETHA